MTVFNDGANRKCVSWAELAEWLVNVSRSKVWNPDRSQYPYPQVHCFLSTVNVTTSSESRHFQFDLQLINLLMRILREDVSYCLACSNAVGRYSEALHSDTLLLVFLLLLFGNGHCVWNLETLTKKFVEHLLTSFDYKITRKMIIAGREMKQAVYIPNLGVYFHSSLEFWDIS